MKISGSLAAAVLLAFSGLALPARAASPAAYDVKFAPLDDLSKGLLTENGYEIRDDGHVWDKITETQVAREDMPYLLSRLASARRLKALLEINNIITRYDSERHLTPEDREAVRAIVRQNWEVFGVAPRGDFRSYFSIQEQEELDKIPARFDSMSPLTMTDPAPESVTAAPPVAAVPPAVPPVPPVPPAPAAAAPEAAKVIPTLTPLMDLPSLKRESPFATAPVPTPAPVAEVPKAVPAAAISSAPAPSPVAVAASTVPAAVQADLGTLKPWTPPPASTAAVAAPLAAVAISSPPAPVPAPVAPVPEPPKPAVIGAAEYDQFVAAGPYSKEDKALLALIGKRAPDYCLPLLRRTVVGAIPQIALDGGRTGRHLRAGLILHPQDPLSPPTVALSPGPVMIEAKRGLFGGREAVVLFESTAAWAELGVARPPLAVWTSAAPASVENGEWGAVRVYADGSRRGTYSSDEQAGELLEQLLRLGLDREGLDASEYAARRWARTARLLFEARLKDETKQDGFLDPDRRAELRDWLDHPEEADDAAAAAWAGSRLQAFDPRRGPPDAEREFDARARASCGRAALEDALADAARRRAARVGSLETLLDAGAIGAADAKAAAQAATDQEAAARARLLASPPACAAPDPRRDEGLRKASLLLAEAARGERVLREAKGGLERHDR